MKYLTYNEYIELSASLATATTITTTTTTKISTKTTTTAILTSYNYSSASSKLDSFDEILSRCLYVLCISLLSLVLFFFVLCAIKYRSKIGLKSGKPFSISSTNPKKNKKNTVSTQYSVQFYPANAGDSVITLDADEDDNQTILIPNSLERDKTLDALNSGD